MKKVKQLASALTLIFVFTVTSFAGDIHIPGEPDPPDPPPVSNPIDSDVPGETLDPGVASSLTDALSLLRGLLFIL